MTDTSTSPADLRTVERADVFKGDRLAGHLVREGPDVVFVYDDDYRADPGSPALAWRIPLNGDPVRAGAGSVPAFFAGLLPEGARLQAVVAASRTSVDDHLTLLLAVGTDTVGDVRVFPAGREPTEAAAAIDSARIGDLDLAELFAATTGPETLRIDPAAIPGVQPKVSAAMISAPVRTSQGPAILKLNPPEYPLLLENESFFLDMARACDLDTPDHALTTDKHGRTGLLIRRFDRDVTATGETVRLAQEDACQVMGVYPARKYTLHLGDVVTTLAATCERGGGSRVVAATRLLRLIAFSYLIGNTDLHGKNISIRRNGSGTWEVTPGYDLLSVVPYDRWADPMALDLYGRANRLTRAHLIEAAARWGVRQRAVERLLDRLCDRAETWVERIGVIGFDERTTTRLQALVSDRIGELRGERRR